MFEDTFHQSKSTGRSINQADTEPDHAAGEIETVTSRHALRKEVASSGQKLYLPNEDEDLEKQDDADEDEMKHSVDAKAEKNAPASRKNDKSKFISVQARASNDESCRVLNHYWNYAFQARGTTEVVSYSITKSVSSFQSLWSLCLSLRIALHRAKPLAVVHLFFSVYRM